MNKKTDVRIERDKYGEVHVPSQAYWGAQTARNREIGPVSGLPLNSRLIEALATVKKSAALANAQLGRLDQSVGRALAQSCDEILNGQWRDQFIADPLQTGAGAAIIANINEVLANRASQLLGSPIGTYERVHPHLHVNTGQSTNDVFPTAMRLAILLAWRDLEPVLKDLERLLRKSLEFDKIAKVGRSHLQDSVPITLGQEFNAYGSSVERSVRRIKEASNSLLETNLGCTAVGTGFGAESAFAGRVIETLCSQSGFKFRQAEDVFRVTQSMSDFVEFSSALRELAIELGKIASDLRLMASGPAAGFGEIKVPPVQPEPSDLSPILPDKTPPHLLDGLNMVCFQVLGNDYIVGMCAQAGQMDTNAMTPLIIVTMLSSLDMLKNCINAFNSRCLSGITADAQKCQQLLDQSGAAAGVISAYVGAEKAAELLHLARESGKSVREVILEANLMSADVLDRILHYKSLTRPSNVPIGGVKPSTTYNTNAPIDKG